MKRVSSNVPDLDIRWLSDSGERGLIARPATNNGKFLEQWILNPGVAGGKLTADNTEEQADLVAVSGHGGGGYVYGNALGAKDDNRILLGAHLARHVSDPSTGRLKYLLVPSCSNLSEQWADQWLPILKKEKPVHGVLGYSATYPGDTQGAELMRNFCSALKADPARLLLDVWAEINEKSNPPVAWGAAQRVDARNDNLRDWVTKGLDVHSDSDNVVWHYDHNSFPTGKKLLPSGHADAYEIHFVMDDGTVLQEGNNSVEDADASRGLFPGQRGVVRIRAKHPEDRFSPRDKFTVMFYFFRPLKHEMDLDALLIFDEGLFHSGGAPFARKLIDANELKRPGKTGKVDALEVTSCLGQEVRLPFTVAPGAKNAFPRDPNGPNTHGLYTLGLYPPGARVGGEAQLIWVPKNGAWLK
ncbi:hypothetical protein LVJ94_25910 [Pendulispora rubella]|uniref:Uncharacterized protein n=1 Tax=Pendulispora rubella TaxID=2741070 RepID=A0ABZ2LN97_9BACT